MTDAEFDRSSDGELLSAYLAGDLDDVTAKSLERRLAAEPHLARQLDALATALMTLGDVDAVTEPEGFAQRLDERLGVERATPSSSRRTTARGWIAGLGSVAAVAVAVAVVSTTVIGSGGQDRQPGTAEVAQDDSGGLSTTQAEDDDMAAEAPAGAQPESADEAAGSDATSDAGAPVPSPLILYGDQPAEVAGEQALRRRYRDLPEVQEVLGLSLAAAEDVATGHTRTVNEYDADPPPQQCLDVVTAEAAGPVVPVRVEQLVYAGQPAIAYVIVTASPQSEMLDRVEVWVVADPDCTAIVFLQL